MSNKGLFGLIVVTIVAVLAAIFVARGGNGPATDPLAGTKVLPGFATRIDAVSHITLVSGTGKTTFERHGNEWLVEEKGGYPADPAKVQQMILGLGELTFVEPKTSKPALYSRLDLDDPTTKGATSTLVTASDDNGHFLGEIIAGKRKVDELGGGNDGIYVRKPGDAQSWLARGTLDLSPDTVGWLDQKILDLPVDQVKAVALTAADGGTLDFARAKPATPFALDPPLPAGKTLKSDGALSDPAGALGDLQLTDVKPAKGVALPAAGFAKARYEGFDGLVVTVTLFGQNGTDWAKIEASGSGAAAKPAAALEAKVAPWIYGISSDTAKLMETKLADVIAPPKGS